MKNIFYKLFRFWLKFLGIFNPCPFGKELQGYWNVRNQIFSKFKNGVKTDEESLYSAIPEKVGFVIADHFKRMSVIDGFCGAGSLTIALARIAKKVIAIELNPNRLEMAKHNANIYGVREKIEFISGNFFTLVYGLKAGAVFLDPPWGGPKNIQKESFCLKDFPEEIEKILPYCLENFKLIAFNIPKNFNLEDLRKLNKPFSVEDNFFLGELAFKTVYFKNA